MMIAFLSVLATFAVVLWALDFALRQIAWRAPVLKYLPWRWAWFCVSLVLAVGLILIGLTLVEITRIHP